MVNNADTSLQKSYELIKSGRSEQAKQDIGSKFDDLTTKNPDNPEEWDPDNAKDREMKRRESIVITENEFGQYGTDDYEYKMKRLSSKWKGKEVSFVLPESQNDEEPEEERRVHGKVISIESGQFMVSEQEGITRSWNIYEIAYGHVIIYAGDPINLVKIEKDGSGNVTKASPYEEGSSGEKENQDEPRRIPRDNEKALV